MTSGRGQNRRQKREWPLASAPTCRSSATSNAKVRHRFSAEIEGEVRASDLQISDGAQVEGSVIAQNVTICGRVKGTIRAVRVKLQSGGAVEGDIFHRSLSIDENSQFEGSSRRVENPTDPSSSVDAKGPQKKGTAPAPLPSINAELGDGPKH